MIRSSSFKLITSLPPFITHPTSSFRKIPRNLRVGSRLMLDKTRRALARGDNPEEIMRRIADFRAEEKPNPEYYARHTDNVIILALLRDYLQHMCAEGRNELAIDSKRNVLLLSDVAKSEGTK